MLKQDRMTVLQTKTRQKVSLFFVFSFGIGFDISGMKIN